MSEQLFFRLPDGGTAQSVDLVVPVEGVRRFTASEAADLREVVRIVSEHQERMGRYYSNRLPEVIRSVIGHYHDLATGQLRRTKEFRDDVMIHLRALALVVEMAGSAATHAEKNARLRGVGELIGGAIEKLRRERFEISSVGWPMFEDVFRSDYPTRELLQRIRELEAENARLSGEPEDGPASGDGDTPY